ncbi:MAG TPA: hypothetical protein VED59_09620 [Acidimicrobiales bacterium]|nr:hypothetical protein [Acidimicrobiales bacterium]
MRDNKPVVLRSVAILAMLATSLFLVASCGGVAAHSSVTGVAHGTTTTSQSRQSSASKAPLNPVARALEYSVCMRKHGVPGFPDPSISHGGGFGPNPGIGFSFDVPSALASSPAYHTAKEACHEFYPFPQAPPQPLPGP